MPIQMESNEGGWGMAYGAAAGGNDVVEFVINGQRPSVVDDICCN